MEILDGIKFCNNTNNWAVVGPSVEKIKHGISNNDYINIFYFEPSSPPCLKDSEKIKILKSELVSPGEFGFVISEITTYSVMFDDYKPLVLNVIWYKGKPYHNKHSVSINILDVGKELNIRATGIFRETSNVFPTYIERDYTTLFDVNNQDLIVSEKYY